MSDKKNSDDMIYKIQNVDQLLSLMTVYQNEWKHREERLWKQAFRFYYATLIVSIFPYLANHLKITNPVTNEQLFPIIGIVMSLLLLYINISAAMKTGACYTAYRSVVQLLDCEEYGYIEVKDRYGILGRIFGKAIGISIVIAMSISLVAIDLILLI